MLELYLVHERRNPDAPEPAFGSEGPRLVGVKSVHCAYGTPRVKFNHPREANTARRLTGWPSFDDVTLEMRHHQDLVEVRNSHGTFYYSDWGVT